MLSRLTETLATVPRRALDTKDSRAGYRGMQSCRKSHRQQGHRKLPLLARKELSPTTLQRARACSIRQGRHQARIWAYHPPTVIRERQPYLWRGAYEQDEEEARYDREPSGYFGIICKLLFCALGCVAALITDSVPRTRKPITCTSTSSKLLGRGIPSLIAVM